MDISKTFRDVINLDVPQLVESWNRAPIFSKGSIERIASLGIDRSSFFEGAAAASELKAQFFNLAGEHCEIGILPTQAHSLFDAAMTICHLRMDRIHASLRQLARSAKQCLHYAGDVYVNGYLSPPGKGFGLHFDRTAVFVIQLEGEKRWSYSPVPAVLHPSRNVLAADSDLQAFSDEHPGIDLARPPMNALEEQLLRPGDVLFLPPGTWHRAVAGSDGSLALSLSFGPIRFTDLVAKFLETQLPSEDSLRANIPPAYARDGVLLGLPEAVRRCLDEGLSSLSAAVRSWTPDGFAKIWRDQVAADEGAPAAVDSTLPEILPSDRFEVMRPLSIIEGSDDDQQGVFVYLLDESVFVPKEVSSQVCAVLRRANFRADELVDEGCSWEHAMALLNTLRESRLVRQLSERTSG